MHAYLFKQASYVFRASKYDEVRGRRPHCQQPVCCVAGQPIQHYDADDGVANQVVQSLVEFCVTVTPYLYV